MKNHWGSTLLCLIEFELTQILLSNDFWMLGNRILSCTCYRPTFHLHTSIHFLLIHFFVSWSIYNCMRYCYKLISLNQMNALFMTFDLKWRHSWIVVQKPVSIDYIPPIDFVHIQRNAIRFDSIEPKSRNRFHFFFFWNHAMCSAFVIIAFIYRKNLRVTWYKVLLCFNWFKIATFNDAHIFRVKRNLNRSIWPIAIGLRFKLVTIQHHLFDWS